ncbi:MAG: TraR/DksA family transcriptional regulator [Microbacterium sp.]
MTPDLSGPVADRRAEVTARLAAVEARLAAIRAARSDATDDDEHDPEGSTLSSEWSRAEGQRADALRELAELDAAVERLREGTYGICVSCGTAIPLERLRLLPAATLCVPCASAR